MNSDIYANKLMSMYYASSIRRRRSLFYLHLDGDAVVDTIPNIVKKKTTRKNPLIQNKLQTEMIVITRG